MSNSESAQGSRTFIRDTVIQTVPLLAVYFGLRAYGIPQYIAMGGVIIASTIMNVVIAFRKRKFEPHILIALLLAACDLAIVITTKNARIVQAVDSIPGFFVMFALFYSAFTRKPLTKKAAKVFAPNAAEKYLSTAGQTPQGEHDWNALHVQLSSFCGFSILAANTVMLIIIFTLPVDISQILIAAISVGGIAATVVYVTFRIKSFVKNYDFHVPVTDLDRVEQETF